MRSRKTDTEEGTEDLTTEDAEITKDLTTEGAESTEDLTTGGGDAIRRGRPAAEGVRRSESRPGKRAHESLG
jgi:hypothetical protein